MSRREIELVLSLLPPHRRVLDLGCGTGRLTRVLAEQGPIVGLDASAPMLAETRRDCRAPLVQGDAFVLPFANGSFDAVVALRLAFHFAALDPLLREAVRVLTQPGTVIFDTYLWSPRAWLSLDREHWGGGVFAHSPAEIERTATQLGLRIARREACFLFSPYIYRRLPLAIVRLLANLETLTPRRLRARVFWAMERG